MIFDFHCHAGKGDLLTDPWNTDAPLEQYLRRARAAGITRTMIFPAFHSDYSRANREVARICRNSPGRLIGCAFVHARRDAGRIREMLDQAVLRWGFRCVKVHGADALPTREVCDASRALSIPILVDVTGQASAVEMLATQYPDVAFIIPHLGSFRDDWRAQQQVCDQLVRFPNVYADTSGVRRFDYIVQAIRRAGAQKLLFGSDGPWLHPAVELHKIRVLRLPADQERLILCGNAMRLLQPAGVRKPHTGSIYPSRGATSARASEPEFEL